MEREFGFGRLNTDAEQAVGYTDQELGQRSRLEVDLKSPGVWSLWGRGPPWEVVGGCQQEEQSQESWVLGPSECVF